MCRLALKYICICYRAKYIFLVRFLRRGRCAAVRPPCQALIYFYICLVISQAVMFEYILIYCLVISLFMMPAPHSRWTTWPSFYIWIYLFCLPSSYDIRIHVDALSLFMRPAPHSRWTTWPNSLRPLFGRRRTPLKNDSWSDIFVRVRGIVMMEYLPLYVSISPNLVFRSFRVL